MTAEASTDEIVRSELPRKYAAMTVSTLDDIIGVFLAVTVGRWISMRMVVTKTPEGYRCVHTVFNIPVATSMARIAESPVGDGVTYFIAFPNRLMNWLWCDEMRLLPNGGLVGRITALPTRWKQPLKYFAYRRES
jgi:hypothetical protein